MITLFGATGYTGQRIAYVLDREGLAYRLAGRSPEKLAELSGRLSARPSWLIADATQPGSLPPLFQGSQVLVNCAGPFTDLGERVITQAAMSGSAYLDITNELGFVLRARGYSQMAARTGSVLVPSCAFEVALADCAAALIGQKLLSGQPGAQLDRIDVVYELSGGGASGGTLRSSVRTLATSWVAYRDGEWTGQIPGGKVRRFHLPGGTRSAFLIPSSESATLPLHLPLRRVDVWMTARHGTHFWAPVLIPLLARLSRSILRPLILKIAGARGRPASRPAESGLVPGSPFTILVSAFLGQRSHWIALNGHDPYGLTAEIAVYAASRLADDHRSGGLLAPSQAFDPQVFLDHAVQHWGITVREGEDASS